MKKDEVIFLGKAVLGTLLGGVTGLAVGTVAGRASAGLGLATSGAGVFVLTKTENKKTWGTVSGYFLIAAGGGMIASPRVTLTASQVKGLKGFEGLKEDSVASAKMAIATISSKFWLDKTPLAKFIPQGVSGLAEIAEIAGLGSLGNSETRKAQLILEQLQNAQMDTSILPKAKLNGLSDDYSVKGLGNLKLENDFAAILDVSEAVGELTSDDQQEISGLAAAEDYEMGEMAAEIIASGGTLEPLAAPGDLLHKMEARKGKGKMGKFRDRVKNIGSKLRGKKRSRKSVSVTTVSELPEVYQELIGGLETDYK